MRPIDIEGIGDIDIENFDFGEKITKEGTEVYMSLEESHLEGFLFQQNGDEL